MDKKKKNRIALFGIAIFLIILLGGFIFLTNTPSRVGVIHIVELREEGYFPESIVIEKGDTITFRTTLDHPHWPASNIHPTHGILPEFDPQEPIPPDNEWSFTFEKEGTWQFHDHLAPYYTGEIIVE